MIQTSFGHCAYISVKFMIMKKLFLGLFVTLMSLSINSQELKIGPSGVKEPVIFEFDLTQNEIYKKSLNWVQETYKNPDKVLKANIENEKIRLDGYATNAWWCKSLGIIQTYNMNYTVEISFKEGRCRFSYTIGQMYTSDGQRLLYSCKAFYKSSGDVRKVHLSSVSSLEKTINDLAKSYQDYINGVSKSQDDDW